MKKRKMSNKSIVALSAFAILFLSLSGLLFMSGGETSLTGYQVISCDGNKGSFQDIRHPSPAGPQYFKFLDSCNLEPLKKNVAYDNWDILFTTGVTNDRGLVIIPRQQSTKAAIANVNYNSATLKDCEAALNNAKSFPDLTGVAIDSTNKLPAINLYTSFVYDGWKYSQNTICVKTASSQKILKIGAINKPGTAFNDINWEFLTVAPTSPSLSEQSPSPNIRAWLGKPQYTGSSSSCSVSVPLYYNPSGLTETLVAPVIAFSSKIFDYKFSLENLNPPLVMLEEYTRDDYLTLRIARKDKTLKDDYEHVVPPTKLGTLSFKVKDTSVSSPIKLYFVSTSHEQNRATSVLLDNSDFKKKELDVNILSSCGQPAPVKTPTPSPAPVKTFVKVLSPNGGETLNSEQEYVIKWESSPDIDSVMLSYISVSNGNSMQILNTYIPNTGSYTWKVLNIDNVLKPLDESLSNKNDFKIKIIGNTKLINSAAIDESDNSFSIPCPKVSSLGYNSLTKECKQFQTGCLSKGWAKVVSCPVASPVPEVKPARVSIPIILESNSISQLTGKSIWSYVTGYQTASAKKTVTVKLSYDDKILRYTDMTLRTGADVKAKIVSPGQLEIMYTAEKDLSPGELFKVNFEKINNKSTEVTLDTALENGAKPVKIKRSTSVVKAT